MLNILEWGIAGHRSQLQLYKNHKLPHGHKKQFFKQECTSNHIWALQVSRKQHCTGNLQLLEILLCVLSPVQLTLFHPGVKVPTSSILSLAPSESSFQHKWQSWSWNINNFCVNMVPILAKNVDTLHKFYLSVSPTNNNSIDLNMVT